MLDAYVSGAIDQDLLADEQQKARHETADTERLLAAARINLGDLEGKILAAVALAVIAEDGYRRSAPAMRGLYNQAFFQRLYITADGASEGTWARNEQTLLRRSVGRVRLTMQWCPRWDSNPHALSDNGF